MSLQQSADPASTSRPRRGLWFGLSPRILGLVVLAVMTAEIAIFLPSLARFRLAYLQQLVESGALATLALDATPDNMVDEDLARVLLDHARVDGVVLIEPGKPKRQLIPMKPPEPRETVDLEAAMLPELVLDAVSALLRTGPWELRVGGMSPRMPGSRVFILVDEAPMRQAMYSYAWRILWLSLAIVAFTAGLLYLGLRWLIVRPLQRVSRAMTAFRRAPEDEDQVHAVERRDDEIGIVDREFDILQRELRVALRQKTRLAELGAAMSKINHDLRNMLATAQLVSDRLERSDDPRVREVAPIMLGSIDRAVRLCADTLDYARGRPTPKLLEIDLADLADEVGVALAEQAERGDPNALRDWHNAVDAGRIVRGDRSMLFRALFNLGRNAFEAGAKAVTVTASDGPRVTMIDVADDGPGVPAALEAKLFQPFAASGRPGGSGLGLAIARDLVRAHGGDIALVLNGAVGATFRFTLPTRPPD